MPATSASTIARLVASPSSAERRTMPWCTGSVSPRSTAWAASTSIAMPFSACIMIVAPLFEALCMARRIWASSL